MKAPFKFLDSYSQGDMEVFFGRKKETDNLYDALAGVKHLLVYGPSGAGKTSLIECGLRNQFSDADWFALTIRKGKNIVESVFTAINEVLKNKLDPNEALNFTNLVESLFSEKYQPVYLLFDQFEELLILGEQEEKESFFKAINDLIRYKVPCRILFIMREEFIGYLSEFEYLCPTIFQNRFRLEKMNRNNVQQVIEEILNAPFYKDKFTVADADREKLSKKIIERLPDAQKEIELTHVQVFLSELWERASEGQKGLPCLEDTLVKESDKLETILDSFLKKQLTAMEEKFGKKIPLEVLALMISERNTKLQLTIKEIKEELQAKAVLLEEVEVLKVLDVFEQNRILRKLGSEPNIKFEITHDLLALAVGQNLTEDIKLRQKAVDIYAIYQDRTALFSQTELDYIRPYQSYWDYPVKLKEKIQASEVAIESEKNKVLAQALTAARLEKVLRENAETEQQRAETQRKRADELQQEAKRRSYIAILVAIIALIASVMAWLQYQKAEKQSEEAQVAQYKAQATLDKIYFYQGKYGLAYDYVEDSIIHYGFIDKNLQTKIGFKYTEANSFDKNGLARVKRNNTYYLIDTQGIEYQLASDLAHLNDKITALDLSHKNLSEIPKVVFEQKQLRVLLLNNNQIHNLQGLEKLSDLITLDISSNSISKLEGLGYPNSLQTLDISSNSISKLEGLGYLSSLQTLDISSNSISKLEGLKSLVALKRLDISSNKIERLEGLENLRSLNILNASSNKIKRFVGLENLRSLNILNASSNEIERLEGLENLRSLNILNASSNEIERLEGLENLRSLNILIASNNKIKRLEGLENLRSLNILNASYNQIEKLEGLDALDALTSFAISTNGIHKLEGLENLTRLQILDISRNQISTLEGLQKLATLQTLNISFNEISQLEGLDKLSALHTLYIYNNQISTLEGLEKLTKLKTLNISHNEILELEGLEKLTALQIFDISYNQLSELKGLDKLSTLQILDVSNNQISRLNIPEKLISLEALDLRNNQINGLEGLEKLASLQKLSLEGRQFNKIEGIKILIALLAIQIVEAESRNLEGLEKRAAFQTLNHISNHISKLEGLGKLAALQKLYISLNKSPKLEELKQLTTLQKLVTLYNRISSLDQERIQYLLLTYTLIPTNKFNKKEFEQLYNMKKILSHIHLYNEYSSN